MDLDADDDARHADLAVVIVPPQSDDQYLKSQFLEDGRAGDGKCMTWKCTHCKMTITTDSPGRVWEHLSGLSSKKSVGACEPLPMVIKRNIQGMHTKCLAGTATVAAITAKSKGLVVHKRATIRSILDKGVKARLHAIAAQYIYGLGIPFHTARHPFIVRMCEAIVVVGRAYPPPFY